jgi:hypothetical protein
VKKLISAPPYTQTARWFGLSILLVLLCVPRAAADDWKSVLDLRGQWKFELGDDMNRARTQYNDSKWGEIFVPSAWEDEGYPGYDGYAWYRKHFRLPAGEGKKDLILRLGCVDDVSEIYLNGIRIGMMGSFPPDMMTAYNTEIVIPLIPGSLNVSGDNVIAVRVYDDQLGGGIVQGKIGLYEYRNYLTPELSFAGEWKFKKGDSEQWHDPSLDDSQWKKIFVPAYWEGQGFPYYDGVGWYRLHIKIPPGLTSKNLVLLLGKIDDLDETYVNGEEIGHTGTIRANPSRSRPNGEHQFYRAYPLRSGLLKEGKDNVIAVRVYDGGGGGGIYEGPVGITTRERFTEWKRDVSREVKNENGWDKFLNRLFE